MYKIEGHDRMLIGPDYDIQEMDFQKGDFIYIPRGEIHGAINLDNKQGLLAADRGAAPPAVVIKLAEGIPKKTKKGPWDSSTLREG